MLVWMKPLCCFNKKRCENIHYVILIRGGLEIIPCDILVGKGLGSFFLYYFYNKKFRLILYFFFLLSLLEMFHRSSYFSHLLPFSKFYTSSNVVREFLVGLELIQRFKSLPKFLLKFYAHLFSSLAIS